MNLQPAKTEFLDAEHAEIRRKVEAIKLAEGLTQAEICRQAELPDSNLSRYLKDAYTGDNDPIAAKLNRWLKGRERAAALRLRLPVEPVFQPLHTSTRLLDLLDMARITGSIITVVGPPGVSKTWSSLQYCDSNPRSWYVAIDEATHGVQPMLLEILSAMGKTDVTGSPAMLRRLIVNEILEAQALIVVDEANILSDKALNQLRAINDATQRKGKPVGIALLGNEEVTEKVGPTGKRIKFAQMSSRITTRKVILAPDKRDVTALADAWAAANGEHLSKAEYDFFQDIAGRPGGLRNVEKTFRQALLVTMATSEPLTVEHLRGAFHQASGLWL